MPLPPEITGEDVREVFRVNSKSFGGSTIK